MFNVTPIIQIITYLWRRYNLGQDFLNKTNQKNSIFSILIVVFTHWDYAELRIIAEEMKGSIKYTYIHVCIARIVSSYSRIDLKILRLVFMIGNDIPRTWFFYIFCFFPRVLQKIIPSKMRLSTTTIFLWITRGGIFKNTRVSVSDEKSSFQILKKTINSRIELRNTRINVRRKTRSSRYLQSHKVIYLSIHYEFRS